MVTPPLNLKIMNHVDVDKTKKYLGQIYSKAHNHISQILHSLPKSATEDLIDGGLLVEPKNGAFVRGKKTIEDLQAGLNDLKGKKTSHEERLLKKKLKNQLKKKKLKEMLMKKKLEGKKGKASKKNIENDLESSELQFNKLDFTDGESEVKKKNKFKKERPRVEKDPSAALKRIEGLSEKITKLTEAGEKEKAQDLVEKDKWKCALLKAEGLKVKDNPTLLRKSIKKKENQKKKSTEAWKQRVDTIEKKKEEAQKKRKDNIMKKKKEKKSIKIKKSMKKGRVVL